MEDGDELKNLANNMDKVIVVSRLKISRGRNHLPDQMQVKKAGNASHLRNVV